MIKLERGECPKELDEETRKELTKLYKQDKTKFVWNSPKIKQPLKDALMDMSKGKCVYCECRLNEESKDVTIDHFIPKTVNEDLVVKWENLFPSCLRCNRIKNDNTEEIVNPCNDNPKKHLKVLRESCRLRGITEVGKNTIEILELNDIDRVIKPRMAATEVIIEKLEEIYDDIAGIGNITPKYVRKIKKCLKNALEDKPYSGTVSTKVLNSSIYKKIKEVLISKNLWDSDLIEIEKTLDKIQLGILEDNIGSE